MGIVNATPDSFFEGSRVQSMGQALDRIGQMLEEGASIIDLGGVSTRPAAMQVPENEEIKRVLPLLERAVLQYPQAFFSIDTYRSAVARIAVEAGARLVNDVSAGRMDAGLYHTMAGLNVPYVLMHMKGNPQNMQDNPAYESVVLEILDFFISEVEKLRSLGIKDIILDPGFGFGKKLGHNYELLTKLHVFSILGLPVLAGLSRKSMIYNLLGKTPEQSLPGTMAANMVALQQGAKILRVHDVGAAVDLIKVFLKVRDEEGRR